MKSLLITIALLLISSGLAAQSVEITPIPPAEGDEWVFDLQEEALVGGISYAVWQEHVYHYPDLKRSCMDRDLMEFIKKITVGVKIFRDEKPDYYDGIGLLQATFSVVHAMFPCLRRDDRPVVTVDYTENLHAAIEN